MSWSVRRRRIVALTVVAVLLAGGALAIGTVSGRAATSLTGAVTRTGHQAAPPKAPTSLPMPTPQPTSTGPARPSPTGSQPPAVVPTFNRSARSIDDPTSLWAVVDKVRPLQPADYTPPDLVEVPVPHVWQPMLRAEASNAVVAMFAAFTAETGLQLQSQSSYRSYGTQVDVYNQDVAANGQAFADTSTARPGTSEHQTGLAIDISALPGNCSLDPCFGATPHGQWLAQNAWRFGFLLRYPADKVPITGYGYEPWHFRYIGADLATEMHNTGVTTLEEFFGLPAAPGYN
ncbi:D-alanyl-D-alanine carboxypeptidase [Cryobacterium sp. MP_M5]|uniref:M15 family metallopeptidase n=1 Tax=Cryobacterium sp. MP_M5 TaxID=3071715 RepID=UPI001A2DF5FA|nr:D-alanyl-D-alanine carboxypeptidase [Cryobacterium sp. MP_M3]MEC5177552.1 D-alanyl-D-alanine carboxypeptidase [Cryobacterium sp. MP_M5]